MDTKFKDPIAVREMNEKKKAPWDFRAPHYDERSSCYVNAGSHYGVGHKQPVGHSGTPKQTVDVLPQGRHSTMQVSEVPHKNLPVEIQH